MVVIKHINSLKKSEKFDAIVEKVIDNLLLSVR